LVRVEVTFEEKKCTHNTFTHLPLALSNMQLAQAEENTYPGIHLDWRKHT